MILPLTFRTLIYLLIDSVIHPESDLIEMYRRNQEALDESKDLIEKSKDALSK